MKPKEIKRDAVWDKWDKHPKYGVVCTFTGVVPRYEKDKHGHWSLKDTIPMAPPGWKGIGL